MVEVLTDVEVEPGHDYFYRLIATLRRGGAVTFGPVSTAGAPPAREFAFTSIGPSPGDGPMRIAFAAGHEARVRLAVHDVLGRVVEVLVDGTVPAGRHDAVWEGTSVPAGLYFLRLEWPGGAATRRVALTR
jgi:hypothetical protein